LQYDDKRLSYHLHSEHPISDSEAFLTTVQTVSHMETQVYQKEDEKWKRNLKESLDADHQEVMKELAASNFSKRITECNITENDRKTISRMMQRVR
jgi:hypothetical protein